MFRNVKVNNESVVADVSGASASNGGSIITIANGSASSVRASARGVRADGTSIITIAIGNASSTRSESKMPAPINSRIAFQDTPNSNITPSANLSSNSTSRSDNPRMDTSTIIAPPGGLSIEVDGDTDKKSNEKSLEKLSPTPRFFFQLFSGKTTTNNTEKSMINSTFNKRL